MMKHLALLMLANLLWACSVPAEPVQVVTTIKPVHSLVSSILGDTGEATLLISGGASPHTFSLKPSHAAALARADLVIWVGPALERFLEAPLANLADKATHLALVESDGLQLLSARNGGAWTATDLSHHHGEEDHHNDGRDEQTHAGLDPHIWLDPQNAVAMSHAIEAALSRTYPTLTETFKENAIHLRSELEALDNELRAATEPVKGQPFFVFHDAFQYFEAHYDLTPLGALTATPDLSPGARRLQELRETGDPEAHICVFAEPQFEPRTMQVLIEGRNATLAYLDPLGSMIEPGADHYAATLQALSANLVACLSKTQ